SSGSLLHGVTIINNSNKKVLGATNQQGQFNIRVNVNTKLLFRAVGYNNLYVDVVAGKTRYNVVLEEAAMEIEETVVVGYQARKRETLTGSAVTISGKEIQDVPVANCTDLLQGKVAGMNVQLHDGTPGMRGAVAIGGMRHVNGQGSGGAA